MKKTVYFDQFSKQMAFQPHFFRIHTICTIITKQKASMIPEVYVESYVALNGRLQKNTSIQK
jgi:hypothetical protein